MDIQRIFFDFTNNLTEALLDDKSYDLEPVENASELKTELDLNAGFSVVSCVAQYTVDQHESEPRLVVTNGLFGEENQFKVVFLSSITGTDLESELNVARLEVEAEITVQNN